MWYKNEYIEFSGNFQQITRTLLCKIHQNSNYALDYDKKKINIEDNIIYLCVTKIFPEEDLNLPIVDIKINL